MAKDHIFALCDIVRETSFSIHSYLRHGHFEKIYENALVHRLRKQAIRVDQQWPLCVRDEDGTVLGEYAADILVDGVLLVELKACKALVNEHIAQLLVYMRATDTEHGLLINFGAPKFEIRKYVLSRGGI